MTETNKNIVKIHGNNYMTVAGRVQLAHDSKKDLEIMTEVLYQEPVVVKATVKVDGKTFTGISAANPSKAIEKQSPYEVAETSAVGRALGFAGFGAVDSIASADEVVKATSTEKDPTNDWTTPTVASEDEGLVTADAFCLVHKVPMEEKVGQYGKFYSHYEKDHGYCNGKGFKK